MLDLSIRSFDIEGHLIQPGLLAPPLVCGSTADKEPGSERLHSKEECRQWFRANVGKIIIVGQNLVFDLGVMCADDPTLVEAVFEAADRDMFRDVGIREALIDIARGQYGIDPDTGRKLDDEEGARYPLHVLIRRYRGIDIKESKKDPNAVRMRYHEVDGIPIDQWPIEFRLYPPKDARHTIDVFFDQEVAAREVVNNGNLHAEADQIRAALALHLASIWGLRTDAESVEELRVKIEAEWSANRKKFQVAGIFRADGTKDTKKLRELVTAAYNGEPPYTPPSGKNPEGQVATDRDTLKDSGDPLLEALADSGKVDKYKSTYLEKIAAGVQTPINARFNVLVSTTRVSSDYQQLPQKGGIRECHCARPGCLYCSVDYGGLELRTMAQRAIWAIGWSKMADALIAKKDPHTMAAATFLGTTYDELLPRVKSKENLANDFRALAKIFNFGKGGGLGAGGMAYQARARDNVKFCQLAKTAEVCGAERVPVIVQGKTKMVCAACVEVSKKYGDLWLEAWPEQRELFSMASDTVRHGKVDVTIPGAEIVRGLCGYTQWLNTPFQGLGAVGAKLATWLVSKEMYTDRKSPLYGSRLVLMVHDELIAELLALSAQQCNDAAERTAYLMRFAMKRLTPDLSEAIEADPAISFVMSKNAATVRNKAGILIPQDTCKGSCGELHSVDWDGTIQKHDNRKGKVVELCEFSGRRSLRFERQRIGLLAA